MTFSIHTGRFAQDDHVVDALASDRADESFGEAVLQGEPGAMGVSRMPMARNRCLTAAP